MTIHTESIFKSRKKIKYHYFFINHLMQEVKHLTSRLFIQATRRPVGIISGLIQPLLWLVLFGALFKNMPLNLFHVDYEYSQFLSCGILIFTCFTGALNAGLPLIFDREFGFLNRLLTAPIISRNAIILASILFIGCITMLQNFIILICSLKSFITTLNCFQLGLIILINILLIITISSFSLSLAFILPGHIEFLAFILIANLPTLFSSTALAPLYLMPYWLQIISKLNILTYAIEALRFITTNSYHTISIIDAFGKKLNLQSIFVLLLFLDILSIIISTHLVNNRLE